MPLSAKRDEAKWLNPSVLTIVRLAAIVAATLTVACASNATPLPGESYRNITTDGAWCWFQDPRAVTYHGARQRTYIGWVTRENGGQVKVAAYDHKSGNIEESTLATLHRDDHANPSILLLRDGRLMVFYSAHNGKEMFCRISKRAEDISEWHAQRSIGTNTQGKGYTYPNPVQLSDEGNRIYLLWRGGNRQPTWSVAADPQTSDGVSWSPARCLIQAGKMPYLKAFSRGKNSIHFAFTNDHPEYASDNNIHYMRYQDGTLLRANGTRIKALQDAPVTPAEADLVYDSTSGGGRAWIWEIADDPGGHPIIVFTVSAHPKEHERRYAERDEKGWEHSYRYARWDGAKWQVRKITDGGRWFPQTQEGKEETEPYYSGGITLDHNDPSTVYLSRQIHGVFEIECWRTPDHGESWKSESITSGSSKLNVRPVVPHGPHHDVTSVLWMHGDYLHYTDYSTGLKMRAPNPERE